MQAMHRFLNDDTHASEDGALQSEDGTHSSGEEGEEHHEEGPAFIAFGMIALALALGIVTRPTLEKWLPIPYVVLLLTWGAVFGVIFTEADAPYNAALNNSIRAWIAMDPRYMQVVFFPILIFVSALNGQFHILVRRMGQVLMLAVPGVIIGAVLTAVFVKYAFPYDWSWDLAMVFGAIVTTTDPVAIVALLQDLGVSEKVYTLIEGESHFSDGASIVIFEVFLENLEGYSKTTGDVVEFAARLSLGGPALGIVIGLLGSFVMGFIINDVVTEVSLTLLLSYGSFALAESTDLKVSGPLALVGCALMLSYYGKPRVSSPVLPSLIDFWKTLQFLANTIVFFLAGLIVVGDAITDERSIDGEDVGYLFLLFIVLYVIRAIVVLISYPVFRTGEYKMTVPQMVLVTHSGLRGAVALILAIVVDRAEAIEEDDRDRIIFFTAGIVVLSLLINGTTIEPLVRYLKLDRATEASHRVFGQSCLALELAMQKHEKHLKEDPFLADANWDVVWRYIPVFTAESYFTRLSTGSISLSKKEVEDVLRVNGVEDDNAPKTGRSSHVNKSVHRRLRSLWHGYNNKFLFDDAGGEAVWGSLKSFLAIAGDESGMAWTGHIKPSEGQTEPHGEHKNGDPAPLPHSSSASSFEGEDHDEDDNADQTGTLSRQMFHRATTAAHKAGVNLTNDTADQEINKSELEETRLRVLYKLKAEYVRAKREGKLHSSGLRVLTEAVDTAIDKVERGSELDAWSGLSGRFANGFGKSAAKFFNWWPAKPLLVELIALKVSFQIGLAWNFLEAHHESSIKGLLAANGAVSAVQRKVNIEIQQEIDNVEVCIQKLTKEAPLIVLSVKTSKAARIMLEHYREEMEHLAEKGHLDEHEEEHLQHAITNSEILISHHPNLESLPGLDEVLEKVEFLRDLQPEQRQHLIDKGACYYRNYVGDVRLMDVGKLGARGTKNSSSAAANYRVTKKNSDTTSSYRGWFYVVRGQVERQWNAGRGGMEYANYSAGTVFGITDTMLGRPHHAGYTTRGFSQLVVFDHHLLMQAAESMPELEYTLWKAVAAHSMRRNSRFSKCKLHCLHALLSRAAFLNGKSGVVDQETIEIAATDTVVLMHGNVFEVKGAGWPLGHATADSAPILVEPTDGAGGSIKVTGDYKAFSLPSAMLAEFVKEERDRMMMQETREQNSRTLSNVKDAKNVLMKSRDEIGAEKAMELMTGLKKQ